MKVGFIGLGIMGKPMSMNLLKAGNELVVFDFNETAVAEVVAAGAKYDGDAWDLVLDGSKVKAALPIFDVLTLSATGTEMDPFAVISDMSKNEKWGTGSPYMVPTMSILNPEYTFSEC